MRISKLHIEESLSSKKGLNEIILTSKPLGSTVALVGKNGAGKSRILSFIIDYFENMTSDDLINENLIYIPDAISQNYLKNINLFKSQQSRQQINSEHAQKQIDSSYSGYLRKIKIIGPSYMKVVDNDDLQNIKETISANQTLTFEALLKNTHLDVFNSFHDNNGNASQNTKLFTNEFSALNSKSTISYIQSVANNVIKKRFALYLKNPHSLKAIDDELRKDNDFKLFDKFQNYIKQFLGNDFSYEPNQDSNLIQSTLFYNGQEFKMGSFSPGQKTLFAYAVLFFYLDINSKTNIKDSIIIIDEPEKHLHPAAQLDLIDALQNIIKDRGQLWIATHSINILSHLEFDEILMVKDDGIILPSRTTPGNSFTELMGIEGHIQKLIQFVNSISEWAYGNFMTQCFKQPDVIFGNSKSDPQYKLFKKFVLDQEYIKLLDYGAGVGRIGTTINEDDDLINKIAYSAFEPDPGHNQDLKQISGIEGLYNNVDDIPNESFNCILLCNVLHEIQPEMWIDVFTNIKNKLSSDGYLLIIEDKFLPKGEHAHNYGYLIFGIEQLEALFNLKKGDNYINLKLDDDRFRDRISFTAFSRETLNVTPESIIQSITSLEKHSFKSLRDLRNQTKDLSQGRLYANQTQLYINSKLALEGLLKKK